MVQPDHPTLSINRQCDLLDLARSSFYYRPAAVPAEELALMRQIDKIYTARPFHGSRGIVSALRRKGQHVNRKRIQRLMRVMGLQGRVPGPHTSRPHPEHPVYPYLLRNLEIVRPDHVWATDISVPQQAA